MRRSYSTAGGSRWSDADDEGLLGYAYGSTASDGQRLTADDGGVRQRVGGIRSDAIDDPRFQRGRAQGFFGNGNNSGNPRNFGRDVASRNQLDSAGTRPMWPAGAGWSGDRGDPSVNRPLKNRNSRSKGTPRFAGGSFGQNYYGGYGPSGNTRGPSGG